ASLRNELGARVVERDAKLVATPVDFTRDCEHSGSEVTGILERSAFELDPPAHASGGVGVETLELGLEVDAPSRRRRGAELDAAHERCRALGRRGRRLSVDRE